MSIVYISRPMETQVCLSLRIEKQSQAGVGRELCVYGMQKQVNTSKPSKDI